MRKLIEVKKEHISRGLPCKSASCPIALALHDAGYKNVLVDASVVRIGDGNWGAEHVNLPTRAKRFIYKFDSRKPVKPFKFWFDPEAQ